jgi:iron complex outermembrane receptor protein
MPAISRFALKPAVLALLTLAAAGVQAQTSQRVEVTGSAIKRIDAETALPVQVISRDDIVKAGITTAAELVATIAAAANNLTDGVSIATGGFATRWAERGQPARHRRLVHAGAAERPAHGQLRQPRRRRRRRPEQHPHRGHRARGDAAGRRVGHLRHRRHRRRHQLHHAQGLPGPAGRRLGHQDREGGAGKRRFGLSAAPATWPATASTSSACSTTRRPTRCAPSQRQVHRRPADPERLPHLLSSATFPANIRLSRASAPPAGPGLQINGEVVNSRTHQPQRAGLQPPHSLNLPDGIGGSHGCTYDFMRDVELSPKSDRWRLTRGVFQLGGRPPGLCRAVVQPLQDLVRGHQQPHRRRNGRQP